MQPPWSIQKQNAEALVYETEYLEFHRMRRALDHRTQRYAVVKSAVNSYDMEILGWVHWYGAWRQYCFYPADGTLWSGGCLEDVTAFLRWIMAGWRGKKGEGASAPNERERGGDG